MFSRVMLQWFWDCYDHLGRLILANVLIFLLLFGSLFYVSPLLFHLISSENYRQNALVAAGYLAFLLPFILTIWFSFFGHFADQVSREKDPPFKLFFTGLRNDFWRYLLFFYLIHGAMSVCLFGFWFYGLSGMLGEAWKFPGYILSGLCFWLALVALLVEIAAVGLIPKTSLNTKQLLLRGLYVLLAYPGFTFFFFIFLVSVWILSIFFLRFAPVMIFAIAGTPMLFNSVADVLLSYEQFKKEVEDEKESAPKTWREYLAREKKSERQKMDAYRYSRTFRDLIKPWDDSES